MSLGLELHPMCIDAQNHARRQGAPWVGIAPGHHWSSQRTSGRKAKRLGGGRCLHLLGRSDLPGALETVNAQKIDTKLHGGLGVPDGRTLVQDDAASLLELGDDRAG